MRLTGRRAAAVALLAAAMGLAVAVRGAPPTESQTELLPGVSAFGGAAASSVHASRQDSDDVDAVIAVQGLTERRLVLWPLDSSPPQEVDRGVALWPLLPSPDGARVLYGVEHAVMVLDVAARRSTIAGALPPNSRLLYAQWAPDGEALAYVVQTSTLRLRSFYALADGSIDAQEMLDVPYGLELDVGWTYSGDPVSMTLGVGMRGGLETLYYRYDPATGIAESLTGNPTANLAVDRVDPVVVIQPWSPYRSPDGRQQIYATTSWNESRYRGACRTGPLAVADSTWLAKTLRTVNYQERVAFEFPGLFMDRPTWLADGRIVFRVVADPVCTTLASGFYVAELFATPAKIVDAEPEYVSEDADKPLWTSSYALSPDQTRIAWNTNDVEGQRSVVHLAPLEPDGGAAAEILLQTEPPAPDAPFAFQDHEMILYFAWLP